MEYRMVPRQLQGADEACPPSKIAYNSAMDIPVKKKLKMEEFLHKVLLELPVLSASEMEQAHLVERHLGLDRSLEDELMALRWWYLTHLLYGQLAHRGKLVPGQALRVVASFVALRDLVLSQLEMDFQLRCEFYERAIQDQVGDECGGSHLYDCFQKFVGRDNPILKEFYYASMMGISNRLAKVVDRFDVVE
jgi:hypothetical protein